LGTTLLLTVHVDDISLIPAKATISGENTTLTYLTSTIDSLAASPTIKLQWLSPKTFEKHWQLLQCEIHNKEFTEHISRVYRLGTHIGKGTFAEIRVATHLTEHREYAIKVITKKRLSVQSLEDIKKEFELVKKLHHPHIISSTFV
jgi:serine/threonine protein kinase